MDCSIESCVCSLVSRNKACSQPISSGIQPSKANHRGEPLVYCKLDPWRIPIEKSPRVLDLVTLAASDCLRSSANPLSGKIVIQKLANLQCVMRRSTILLINKYELFSSILSKTLAPKVNLLCLSSCLIFCVIWILYAQRRSLLCTTLCTVLRGIWSCKLAFRTYFLGLLVNQFRMSSVFSSETLFLACLSLFDNKLPVCFNFASQAINSLSQERDHALEGCIPDEIGVEQASQTLFLLTKEHTKLSVEQSTWLFLQNYIYK